MTFQHSHNMLRQNYKELLWEFLQESSIHGLKLLLYKSPVRYARKLWILFMTAILIAAHVLIIILFLNFLDQPTEIHMSTRLVHVANSPFPAVTICSSNKISKRKLLEYAEKVFQQQELYKSHLLAKSQIEMAEHLLLLTGLYVYPYDSYEVNDERLKKLHNILSFMYNTTNYPTREILENLAPDCESMMLRGMIYASYINISELFYKRMTARSVCCVFNYQRESYAVTAEERAHQTAVTKAGSEIRFEANSILNCIQLVLRHDPDDDAFQQYSNSAFPVYILPTGDFATLHSNVAGEFFVDQNTIVEVAIQPTFFDSNNAVRNFSPKLRNCYYREEGQKLIKRSFYSLDECLLVCRMESMLKYCGCLNPSISENLFNVSTCNIIDLPCLTEWQRFWYRLNFFDYITDDVEQEQFQKSTFSSCNHCLPTCNGITFEIDINEMPLRKAYGDAYSHGLLKGLTSEKPLSIVKLYFEQRYATATEKDIIGDWIVLLNRFGGIMSLLYGFGIVSYIEIIYFCAGKFGVIIYRSLRFKVQQKISAATQRTVVAPIVNDEPPLYTLYWNELQPNYVKNLLNGSTFLQSREVVKQY